MKHCFESLHKNCCVLLPNLILQIWIGTFTIFKPSSGVSSYETCASVNLQKRLKIKSWTKIIVLGDACGDASKNTNYAHG